MRTIAGFAYPSPVISTLVSRISAALLARSTAAVAISFAVELSQLYSSPALDALRRTTAGHLVLGSGFDARDLAAYTLGVLAAAVVERALFRPHVMAGEPADGDAESA